MSYQDDEHELSTYIKNNIHLPMNSITLYPLLRTKKRSIITQIFDLIIFTGALSDIADFNNNLAEHYYLISTQATGTIVCVHNHQVSPVNNIPYWTEKGLEKSNRYAVDGYIYRKGVKIRIQ